jgi:putative DNA primase/helicase
MSKPFELKRDDHLHLISCNPLVTAEIIAKALDGRKAGSGWMARCPAHQDRKPSLSIRKADDGKILVHCHAGCTQESVIDALRQRGLWAEKGPSKRFDWTAPTRTIVTVGPSCEDIERSKSALRVWPNAKAPLGTEVEKYLGSRGLDLPPLERIRFHSGLKHPTGQKWPAMLALVTRGVDDEPIGIHRTFLARDALGKAPVEPQKMMLGPCRGGAVRLAQAGDLLMVGEGIETCLAAMQATGYPAWAALSASFLRTLNLPDDVHDVIIIADGDMPGEAAAGHAALRWRREGRRVRIARPTKGMDFNDMLMGRAPNNEGATIK